MPRKIALIVLLGLCLHAASAAPTRKVLASIPDLRGNGPDDKPPAGLPKLPDSPPPFPTTTEEETQDDKPTPPVLPKPLPTFVISKNITIDIGGGGSDSGGDEGGDYEEAEAEEVEVPICEGVINATCCYNYPINVYEQVQVSKKTKETNTTYLTAPDQVCTYPDVEVVVVKPKCNPWDKCSPCDHCAAEEEVSVVSVDVELQLTPDQPYPPAVWGDDTGPVCFCDPELTSTIVVEAPECDEDC